MKIENMPEEKYAQLVKDGGIHIKRLPNLDKAKKLSHRKLIEILRFCPLSELFGETKRKLSSKTLTEIGARTKVFQLVQQYGDVNAIQELPSLFEASQGVADTNNNISQADAKKRRQAIMMEAGMSDNDEDNDECPHDESDNEERKQAPERDSDETSENKNKIPPYDAAQQHKLPATSAIEIPSAMLDFLSKHGVLQKMQEEKQKFEAKKTSQVQSRASSNLDKLDISAIRAEREKLGRKGGVLKFSSQPVMQKKLPTMLDREIPVKRRNSVIDEMDEDDEGSTQSVPQLQKVSGQQNDN